MPGRGFVPGEEPEFTELAKHCREQGVLFEDPHFPADDLSLFYSRQPPRPFEWKRPHDIVSNPQMFVGGASRLDIKQGFLEDCCVLAAIANLTQYESLFHRVVSSDLTFDKEKGYCGVFRFNFWRFGEWVEVVVDDRLPTYNGKLVFMHSAEKNEFWSALLEKAYAKIHGSYEALKGGQTGDVMEDFTGGLCESVNLLDKTPEDLFRRMVKATDRQCMMGCSIDAKPNEIERKLDNGLVMGHAYSVTSVRKVKAHTRSGEIDVELVRVRNPWGNEREWTGPWSDKSDEWQLISESEKKQLGLTYDDDGEFWMSFTDFMSNFSKLDICYLSPSSFNDSSTRMMSRIEKGKWRAGITAGGCRNYCKLQFLNKKSLSLKGYMNIPRD